MLKHLYIKNYALIEELDIDFHSGFSVVTGETGAGKSIILGAIGLLLGQRADSKSIKTDAQKCTIEAIFDLSRYALKDWFDNNELEYDDNECIIRREITSAGKSRGFINDTPVTLQQMRELGEQLVDIHSQHQNLLLQKEDFQLNVLDIIAGNEKLRKEYSNAYTEYSIAKKELEALKHDISENKSKEDFMRFQLNELEKADLKEDEQEQLEQEQGIASHTEEIKTLLYEANTILNEDNSGIVTSLRLATQKMTSASVLYPKLQELSSRFESTFIDLKDIAKECEEELERIDFNPERLREIEERLDLIYTLERKFNLSTILELNKERERLSNSIELIDNADNDISEKENQVNILLDKLKNKADLLSQSREKSVKKVEEETVARLAALGMPNTEFKIEITKGALSPNGQDKVEFLFTANKGMPLRPVAQVASGGEIARVMLSLKAMISGAVKLPTIIFDEIDTGVSGKVAEQMAKTMQEMGNTDRQVLSITHLPQIAALGKYHYKVEKQDSDKGTTSVMRLLDYNERINEIAQMLSGADITDAAKSNAKELLKRSL